MKKKQKIPLALSEYLVKYGYDEEDADEIHDAYLSGGIDAAVEKFKWADDKEHDYTGELRKVIMDWQKEVGEVETNA